MRPLREKYTPSCAKLKTGPNGSDRLAETDACVLNA